MLGEAIAFHAPGARIVELPAWDCLPYDRASPSPVIMARRLAALACLADGASGVGKPRVLLTTVNAALQRLPSRAWIRAQAFHALPGARLNMGKLAAWCETNGFYRTDTVREAGDFAVRGGILDVFPPGAEAPLRLDFFGETLETVRAFNAETQRTSEQRKSLSLLPVSEAVLDAGSVARFRRGYVARFGAPPRDDALYQAVSAGRRFPGLEHWLALFHETLETIFDYVGAAPVLLDPLAEEAAHERHTLICEYYDARRAWGGEAAAGGASSYQPVEPEALYVSDREFILGLAERTTLRLTPFQDAAGGGRRIADLGGRAGRDFAPERASGTTNIFDAVSDHIRLLFASDKRPLLACWSP